MKIRVRINGYSAILSFTGAYYDSKTCTSVITTQYSNIWCQQTPEEHESIMNALWSDRSVSIPGNWSWGGRE